MTQSLSRGASWAWAGAGAEAGAVQYGACELVIDQCWNYLLLMKTIMASLKLSSFYNLIIINFYNQIR